MAARRSLQASGVPRGRGRTSPPPGTPGNEARSLPEKFVSVDVECVATGIRHDARAVCFVAVVDKNERVLLKKKVKPVEPVVSYLTPLTGFRAGDLDDGESLESVIAEVKGLLGPDVVLVGQGVKNDVDWLHLREGVDYERTVELSQLFKTYNPRYGRDNIFTLRHEANTLLHQDTITEKHDPGTDAKASVQLFKKYYAADSALLARAKQKLLMNRSPTSWAKKNNYRWEGVCMAAYRPDICFCGAPTRA